MKESLDQYYRWELYVQALDKGIIPRRGGYLVIDLELFLAGQKQFKIKDGEIVC